MERKLGRQLSPREKAKHEEIRRKVETEFPPKAKSESYPPKGTIAHRLREARETQGLTWYAERLCWSRTKPQRKNRWRCQVTKPSNAKKN